MIDDKVLRNFLAIAIFNFACKNIPSLSQSNRIVFCVSSVDTVSYTHLDVYKRQAKRLAGLYRLTLDDLIAFDAEVEEIERTIDSISEETQKKVDWTKVCLLYTSG